MAANHLRVTFYFTVLFYILRSCVFMIWVRCLELLRVPQVALWQPL